MLAYLPRYLSTTSHALVHAIQHRLHAATKPAPAPLVTGALADLRRSKPELIAESAFLRQQLIILQRSVKRPRCTATDRALLVLLTSRLRTWRQAVLIVLYTAR